MKITVSLIIVNFNGRKFLDRLFKSINQQTFKNYEVIFIDNSSQDGSIKYIEKYYKNTQIYLKPNMGYGSACNFGVRKAQGKFVVFFNEDMYLPNNFLESMLLFYKQIKNSKKIGGISCKMVDFDKDPEKMPDKYGGQIDLFGFPINKYFKNDIFIISGCPFFINRKVFNQVKGFNEAIFLYGEDVDLSWRLKIFGYHNYMNHLTYLHHYGGGASGGFGPKKIAQNLCVSLIPMYTNYSTLTLILIFPLLFLYIIVISLVLIMIKLDIQYLSEILLYYIRFIKNIKKVNQLRTFVQHNRIYNDWYIYKYVSIVPAFIYNSSYKKLNAKYKIVN